MIKIDKKTVVVFDLDDTLYSEFDYLQSAFKQIAAILSLEIKKDIYDEMISLYENKEDVFKTIIEKYNIKGLTKPMLLSNYRNHLPAINLHAGYNTSLEKIKEKCKAVGLITDGRSNTQRNKLKALGLDNYFNDIIISEEFGSEKPDERNYKYFESRYPNYKYWYIGDNISKDFITPNRLNWISICLKNSGKIIHSSTVEHPLEYQPLYSIESLNELL